MKTKMSVLFVLFVSTINAFADFSVWKAMKSYDPGDAVVRDKILGAPAGPFFCINQTKCLGSAGDPLTDTTDWFYCCSTPIPTPPPSNVLYSGSETNIVITNTLIGNYPEITCLPWNEPITSQGDPSGVYCTLGGLGASPAITWPNSGAVALRVTVSNLPTDGSSVEVWTQLFPTAGNTYSFGQTTLCITSTTGTVHGFWGEVCQPNGSLILVNVGASWTPGNAGISMWYNPGTAALTNIILPTVKWSIEQ